LLHLCSSFILLSCGSGAMGSGTHKMIGLAEARGRWPPLHLITAEVLLRANLLQ
jgi:hypothetical protein